MAKGKEIIVTADPKGTFLEGIVSGTPTPGVVMEVKNSTLVGGRMTWQAWTKASGAYGLIAVLLPDALQGKIGVSDTAAFSGGPPTVGDAYVTGTRCFLYVPIGGEELNMVVASVAGTADDVAIGDLFGVEQTSGKLKANSSYAKPCFTALEAVTDPTADYVLHVLYNG